MGLIAYVTNIDAAFLAGEGLALTFGLVQSDLNFAILHARVGSVWLI